MPLSTLLDLNRPDNQRYMLEQTAIALNIPLPLLIESSRQQHQPHKRPRLSSGNLMPSSLPGSPVAQDAQEKPLLSLPQSEGGNNGRRSFPGLDGDIPSGWTGSRLANCFSSFSMCQPCSPYEAQTGKIPRFPRPLSPSRLAVRIRRLTSHLQHTNPYQPLLPTATGARGPALLPPPAPCHPITMHHLIRRL